MKVMCWHVDEEEVRRRGKWCAGESECGMRWEQRHKGGKVKLIKRKGGNASEAGARKAGRREEGRKKSIILIEFRNIDFNEYLRMRSELAN